MMLDVDNIKRNIVEALCEAGAKAVPKKSIAEQEWVNHEFVQLFKECKTYKRPARPSDLNCWLKKSRSPKNDTLYQEGNINEISEARDAEEDLKLLKDYRATKKLNQHTISQYQKYHNTLCLSRLNFG